MLIYVYMFNSYLALSCQQPIPNQGETVVTSYRYRSRRAFCVQQRMIIMAFLKHLEQRENYFQYNETYW